MRLASDAAEAPVRAALAGLNAALAVDPAALEVPAEDDATVGYRRVAAP